MAITKWKSMNMVMDNNKDDVKELQSVANAKYSFLWGKRAIREDGDYGKMTAGVVEKIQNHLLLKRDGWCGPTTIHWMANHKRNNGIVLINEDRSLKVIGRYWETTGWIPNGYGDCSTFGGPKDAGDNMYGQAYINSHNKPSQLASANPELMDMGILRPGIMTEGEFPMVKFFKLKDKHGNQRWKRSSTSWALNPKSFYCALRTKRSFGMRDDENPRVVIINPQTGQIVVCLRTDYGPAKSTKRVIDISPGAMDALGERTDGDLIIGWAHPKTPIGHYGTIDYKLR